MNVANYQDEFKNRLAKFKIENYVIDIKNNMM